MTNYDYKILAFILANRLQKIIGKTVHENQTAYIKGRYIGENVRLIQDIYEYCETTNKPGLLLSLDFEKAFDSLEWPFMIEVLKKFNFGQKFIRWVQILYCNPTMVFKNNGWISSAIKPSRGIRQGCPISAMLFIIAMEILGTKIRNNDKIQGIKIGQNEYKISQYADDSTMFLHNIESIIESLDTIDKFSRIAGTKLNIVATQPSE